MWTLPFLSALARTGSHVKAARAAGISRHLAVQLRTRWTEFAEAWKEARDEYVDSMEQEAIRRARDGILDVVTHRGEPIMVWMTPEGKVTAPQADGAELVPLVRYRYSDTLLIRILEAELPDKYRRAVDHNHTSRTLNVSIDYGKLTDEQLRQLDAILAAAAPGEGGSAAPPLLASPVGLREGGVAPDRTDDASAVGPAS